MPISSATGPTRLAGASNGPIRWGEAMRIRGLGPSFLSSPSWVNRTEEALDASPHPNGLVKASHFDLDINWDGLPGDTRPPKNGEAKQGSLPAAEAPAAQERGLSAPARSRFPLPVAVRSAARAALLQQQ